MPGFSDLEMQEDFELKQYMDPTLLLDTLSPEDMEIWNNYNCFSDDNINLNVKDNIKEENIEMDYCFNSICPNDLISNLEKLEDSSQSDNIERKENTLNQNLDIFQLNQNLFTIQNNKNSLVQYEEIEKPICVNVINLPKQNNINESLISLSPSCSIISSTCSIDNNYYNTNESSVSNKTNSLIMSSNDTSKCQNSNSSVVFVETNKSSIKKSIINKAITENNFNDIKKPILPPSPPSSFGSDTESDNSTALTQVKVNTVNLDQGKINIHSNKNSIIIPTSSKKISVHKQNDNSLILKPKSSCFLKNSHIKQLRHQPYATKTQDSNQKVIKKNKDKSYEDIDDNINDDDCWPFLCSLSKLPSSGPLLLTEEEKRTLIQEGHQIPSQLPLSKVEEKILKKIRRKIKNKISAQESRRKKKEYVDSLERRMENYMNENVELKKKLEDLEINNKSLASQLQKLQTALSNNSNISNNQLVAENSPSNHFGTFLMILVLFFAVLLGIWSPIITKDLKCSTPSASTTSNQSSNSSSNSISSTAQIGKCSQVPNSGLVSSAVDYITAKNDSKIKLSIQQKTESDNIKIENFSRIPNNNIMDVSPSLYEETTSNIINLNSIARSKTGTTVELTKVRPFVPKIPNSLPNYTNTKNKSNITVSNLPSSNVKNNSSASDYLLFNNSNEDNQIIILNLGHNSQQSNQVSNMNLSKSSNFTNNDLSEIKSNVLQNNIGSKPMKMLGLSQQSYKVINTTSQINKSPTISASSKIGAKFRVINSINSLSMNNVGANNNGNINSSIIKLNS